MNADGTHQRSLVQGSDVQWSPDGKRIAYIAKGEPSRITDLTSAGWTPKVR
jgi:Tol biopolymer transport system component